MAGCAKDGVWEVMVVSLQRKWWLRLLLPCVAPRELDLWADSFPVFIWCKINVTLFFKLHASYTLFSLIKKCER